MPAMISTMSTAKIIAAIDGEIARLQQAKTLLTGLDSERAKPAKRKRNLSPEARARIVAAQRKRWAAQKKTKK